MVPGFSTTKNGAENDIDPFTTYATQQYKQLDGLVDRFDCLEVVVSTSAPNGDIVTTNKIAHVLGIMCIKDESETKATEKLLLFVTYLVEVDKTGTDKLLPYTLFRYDMPAGYMHIIVDVIEPSMIYRPVLVHHCFDRSDTLHEALPRNRKHVFRDNIKKVRFWAITYITLDRFGYEDLNLNEVVRRVQDPIQWDQNAQQEVYNALQNDLHGGYDDMDMYGSDQEVLSDAEDDNAG